MGYKILRTYYEYKYFDTIAQSADETVSSFSNESKETNKQIFEKLNK